MIIRRRYLHDVHADQINADQSAQDTESLYRGQTARYRSAGARSERGVQTIYVESQINRMVSNAGANAFYQCVDSCRRHIGRRHDIVAQRIVIGRADTNLDRVVRKYNAFLGSLIEHCAVVDAFVRAWPRIGVRIEMQQSEWSMFFVMRPQARI